MSFAITNSLSFICISNHRKNWNYSMMSFSAETTEELSGLLQDLRTNSNDAGSGGDASDRTRWLALITCHLALDRLVVTKEEAYLSTRFGAAYEAYSNRVRRWV